MKLLVKTGIGKYNFYNVNYVCIGRAKKKFIHGAEMVIQDSEGRKISVVKKHNENIIIETEGGQAVVTFLRYRTDSSGNRVQESLVRPPMAELVEWKTKWGLFTVRQNSDRTFKIFLQEKIAAEIIHMLKKTKEIHIFNTEIPVEVFMILFSVSWFMFHDDDIII
jgi:hypothetical protein